MSCLYNEPKPGRKSTSRFAQGTPDLDLTPLASSEDSRQGNSIIVPGNSHKSQPPFARSAPAPNT